MPNLNILALETCDRVRQDVRLTTGSAVYVQSDVLMLPAMKTNATAEEAEVFVSALTRTLESMQNYTGVSEELIQVCQSLQSDFPAERCRDTNLSLSILLNPDGRRDYWPRMPFLDARATAQLIRKARNDSERLMQFMRLEPDTAAVVVMDTSLHTEWNGSKTYDTILESALTLFEAINRFPKASAEIVQVPATWASARVVVPHGATLESRKDLIARLCGGYTVNPTDAMTAAGFLLRRRPEAHKFVFYLTDDNIPCNEETVRVVKDLQKEGIRFGGITFAAKHGGAGRMKFMDRTMVVRNLFD